MDAGLKIETAAVPLQILYLSPLIPAPSGNGGRRAIYNHLVDIAGSGLHVDLFVVDIEASGDRVPSEFSELRSRVFPRALPLGRSLRGALAGLWQWIFDARPRAAAVVASREAREAVRQAIAAKRHDVIVVDHLNAWSLVQGIQTDTPVLYIAHNVESDVLADQRAQHPRLSLAGWRLSVELSKMRRYEAALLQRADLIAAIAATDCGSPLLGSVSGKVVVWPELPEARVVDWIPPGSRSLLFVGSAGYFPNRDAIDWLVTRFMPELNRLVPDVELRIAGTARQDVADLDAPSTVHFEGFVPTERLDALHRGADLFICPVVLGSGIKIKVLEATSYGLPIAATAESLGGIDYLRDAALRIDRDPASAARAVADWLDHPARMRACSRRATTQLLEARAARRSLADLVASATPTPANARNPSA